MHGSQLVYYLVGFNTVGLHKCIVLLGNIFKLSYFEKDHNPYYYPWTTQTATCPFTPQAWAVSDHQCSRLPWRSSGTFSRSEEVAHLIIAGWSGSEFQTGNFSIKLQKWSCEVWSYFVINLVNNLTWCSKHTSLLKVTNNHAFDKYWSINWNIKKKVCCHFIVK